MKQKKTLREKLLKAQRNVNGREEKDAAIFAKLTELPQFKQAELVLTYVSTETEVDTRKLIGYCFDVGKPVAIPGIVDEEMRFFLWKTQTENNLSELDELSELNSLKNLTIVPGLAYGKDGNRLGYGGGYYDRFLREFSGCRVGLCYREFMFDVIPIEKHDEKVDIIITD